MVDGDGPPLIVAHKANSLRRIRALYSKGVKAFEIDVIEGASGEVLVDHVLERDEYLELVYSRYKLPRSLRRMLARVLNSAHRHYVRVRPKLGDLLDYLGSGQGDITVMIDIKARNIAGKVSEALLGSRFNGEVLMSSRYYRELSKARELVPHAKTLITLEAQPLGLTRYLKEIGASGVSIEYPYVDENLVRELKNKGFLVAVWTVNDMVLAEYLAGIGVDLIVTDKPVTMMKHLQDASRKRRGSPLI